MAMQVNQVRTLLPLPSDHLEQFSRGISALTIDPYRNALYYFFPFIGAFFNSYHELRNDPSQEAMMPQATTTKILEEVEILTNCAALKRKTTPYIALNHQFGGCGGLYSLTRPNLLIPDQHLFRRDGKSPFAHERPEELLREKLWIYSDDETRFLIARELGQIKENSILLRIAIKVAIIAAIFIIYATTMGGTVGIALFIGVIGIYLISERKFQGRADIIGAEILGTRLNDRKKAFQIAIDTLEKQRKQNLYRRENSIIARVYTTEKGNHVLDFVHHYLTTRIGVLRECEKKF